MPPESHLTTDRVQRSGTERGSRPRRGLEALLLFVAALLFARATTTASVAPRHAGPAVRAFARLADLPPPSWLLPLDDSYIFVRYAQQAARGKPLEWSSGAASTGASSFLLPWLLLPGQWLFHGLAGWSWWSRAVGLASLWLLGLAALRLLRDLGAQEPWPLAGALALIWSGPVGFGAMAGMESGLDAAGILLACSLWIESHRQPPAGASGTAVALLAVVGLLPLLRPENLALTLLAAFAWSLRPPGGRGRAWAVVALLPGLALSALDLAVDGRLAPAGAILKSWLGTPYLGPLGLLRASWAMARMHLIPVYLGLRPPLLWPPVGILAIAGGVLGFVRLIRRRHRSDPRLATALAVPAAAWATLVLLAPVSAMLDWQLMRHHHAGLALAWILATAVAAEVTGRLLRRRSRRAALPLVLPLLLVAAFPLWARETRHATLVLARRLGPASAWLAAHARAETVLVTDAGLLSLAHDGSAVDALGLGTPGMALAYRNGPGARVEALSRRLPLPSLSVVDPALLDLPQLLGEEVFPGDRPETLPVRRLTVDLLRGTPLHPPGIDFADLASEARYRLSWLHPPAPEAASRALLLSEPGMGPTLQGCRPLYGSLVVSPPAGAHHAELALVADLHEATTIEATALPVSPGAEPTRIELPAGSWRRWDIPLPAGGRDLRISRRGRGVGCLESLSFAGLPG